MVMQPAPVPQRNFSASSADQSISAAADTHSDASGKFPNAPDDLTVFDGGPPIHLQMLIGLMTPAKPNIALRMMLVVGIGWVPLVVLVALQSITFSDRSFLSFVSDYSVHARSLIAAPLLIWAEAVILPRLSGIVHHFREAGIVTPAEIPRFDNAVRSTLRLRDSTRLEILMFVLAAFLIVTAVFAMPTQYFPHWRSPGREAAAGLLPASWWHNYISVPFLLVLLLGWLWRIVLWARFLLLMSRLKLRLVASHPDRAGGLKFVSVSVQTFSVLAFILGVIVAGTVANRVLNDGLNILSFQYAFFGFVIFCVFLFASPMLMFVVQLVGAWRRGWAEYGVLARNAGIEMEKRWLNQHIDASVLDANDFSATTDLYSIAANAYGMNVVPLDLRTLATVAIAAALPFVPIVLVSVSPEVIIQKLLG
jgi:hypothetical protein